MDIKQATDAAVAANTSLEDVAMNASMDDCDEETTERSESSSEPDEEHLESEAASIFNDIEKDYRGSDDTSNSIHEAQDHSTYDSTVPVHTSDVGSSLPAAEEVRHDAVSSGRKVPTSRKRWLKLILAVAICLAILLGVGIGLSGQKNKSSQQQPATFEKTVVYLQVNSISETAAFDDSKSPQFRAAQWLADQKLVLPTDKAEAYKYTVLYVLAVNYYALSGDAWNFDLRFLEDSNFCKWKGLVLDPDSPVTKGGVHCDHNDEPIYLELNSNNMIGSIPTENGLLTTLRAFDVQNNGIVGAIPTELCNLVKLEELFLGDNQLTGTVPSCFEQFTELKSLYVNDNNLEEELPGELSNLHKLERLFVNGNEELTGDPLHIFNRLKNLEILLADKNKFFGIIDRKFLSNHEKIEWLDLSENDFQTLEGGLPTHMFKFPSLKVLDLSSNRFESKLPAEIPENDVLEFLSVHTNSLVGGIPKQLANLKSLRHLDLSNNEFHGGIRHEFGAMTNLELLFLGDNPGLSSGNIPASFANLTALQDLSVRNTNRTGSLPKFLGGLKNLVSLDFSHNEFHGDLPDSYGEHWKNMEFFMVNGNTNITGPVPDTFSSLTKLRTILLDGTEIDSNVEETICVLPKFSKMDGHEYAYADCGHKNFECPCCECCTHRKKGGCSAEYQEKLLAKWEVDFQKMKFDLQTPFLDRSYLPAK